MKKLLLTASGIFLAASLYIGINSYKNISSGTDLLLANVEALADGELSECRWATRETSSGWEAICIMTGIGYVCQCGAVTPYY